MLITKLLNFVKNEIIKAISVLIIILFLISIAANIYFIFGNGIRIDKSINTVNLQGQSQSTVIVNGTPYSSDKMNWIKLITTVDKLGEVMNSLTGFQIWNAKIVNKSILSSDIIIFYPTIEKEKK